VGINFGVGFLDIQRGESFEEKQLIYYQEKTRTT
jgi:hypothetical protein